MVARVPVLLCFVVLALLFAVTASAAPPAPVADLQAQRSGADVVLTWTHKDATVDHYEVWRSDTPYAQPGGAGMVKVNDVWPGGLNEQVTYTDLASSIGQTGPNVFYVVRGVNAGGETSAFSNRVAEFDFGLFIAPVPPTPSPTPTPTPTPAPTPTALWSPTPDPGLTPTPTTGPGEGIVAVPATIAANTTWTAGNVYLVTGPSALNAGVTLTIQPGAVVKFQNNGTTKGRLTLNGALLAQGTADAPVIFTSAQDDAWGGDTNTNGGGTSPAAGDWATALRSAARSITASTCRWSPRTCK